MKHLISLSFILLLLTAACHHTPADSTVSSDMEAYEAFYEKYCDSLSLSPRAMCTLALQARQGTTDSLASYSYLDFASKGLVLSSRMDSARLLNEQVLRYVNSRPATPELASLACTGYNMQGNIYSRVGAIDSAVQSFLQAYEWCMKSMRSALVPDILINLADSYNRLGRLDEGAAWYRRALFLCDSLRLPATQRTPIYYGLAHIYVAMRDFELCDRYYNLAAQAYDQMFPCEKQFYLNNRGSSYYYRDDYRTALTYFHRLVDLAETYPDMVFELNLARLNMGDCYLQLGQADSAAHCMQLCHQFFEKIDMKVALYYLDTQRIALALLRDNLPLAARLMARSVTPPNIDPDLRHIRNRYLQNYYERSGDYARAYHFLLRNRQIDDSVRNERVRLHTADLSLRYQQDSTLLAHRALIQEQQIDMLELRNTKLYWIIGFVALFLISLAVGIYYRKQRALTESRNRRAVSAMRLENLRNRLSPHFIFNVLNQEMHLHPEVEQGQLMQLVKMMRRNLELAEQLSVSLEKELDFVATYVDLNRPSLQPDFHYEVSLSDDVCPETVMVPSMLLQIPVENAIKHALRGKEGEKYLWIKAGRTPEGIELTVTDNGGGYRPQSGNRGTGTGMKVIMQTIQILNARNRDKIDVSVHNVPVPTGDIGCEVRFLLPHQFLYRV